jgi:monoamine oxidase
MILIVGAGLSGLLTAYFLKKEGIPFKVLEARNRPGGRINTIYGLNRAPLEMGATWFTGQHEHLIGLLQDLGLAFFEQSMDSEAFYQATPAAAHLVQLPTQSPSFRITGGSAQLIKALHASFDESDILYNQTVEQIITQQESVQVITKQSFEGSLAVLSLPPRLWAKKIDFDPPLPAGLMQVAGKTHTWMEDSIKVALTYEQPFWGAAEKPGTLFSNLGPITEFYDHSNHQKSMYALCGFMDANLKHHTADERRKNVVQQLKSIYGSKAEAFIAYEECVWGQEEFTFEASASSLSPHQNNGNPIFTNALFNGKILISSTETAALFPGYMEGAVYAAKVIAEKLISGRS